MGALAPAIALAEQLVDLLRRLDAGATEVQAPATAAPAPAEAFRPLAWSGKVYALLGPDRGKVFCDRVRWIAHDLEIGKVPGQSEPSWLMTWMAFETGRRFSPSVKNPNSTGTGLIQFMDETAREDLKTTLEHLRSLTAEDQLNFVWRYLRNRIREHGPIRRISDGYLSILMPVYMDDPDETVVWLKDKHKAFAVNAGLDSNKDGQITKAEISAIIYKMLAEGLQPENVI